MKQASNTSFKEFKETVSGFVGKKGFKFLKYGNFI